MAVNDSEIDLEESPEEAEQPGLDLKRVLEIVGFARRSPRRHLGLFVCLLLTGLLLTVAAAAFLPRTYSVEARLLVQRNLVLPALGNPNRAVPREADNLTRNVADVVAERANIVALVKQVNLVDRWEANRSSLQRAKDGLFTKLFGPPTDEDKLLAMVGLVDKKLAVGADEGSVSIFVDWSDPDMAFELAHTVQKNFLDAKYDAEVGMINDAIVILQNHLAQENDNIGVALAELNAARALAKPAAKAPVDPVRVARVGAAPQAAQRATSPPGSNARDAELAALLEERRGQIKRLEDSREQQVADLNRQLSGALGTLTAAHPTVISLKERLEEAQKPSSELETLKSDARALVAQIAAATATNAAAQTEARPAPAADPAGGAAAAAAAPSTAQVRDNPAEDTPAVSLARSKLLNATQKYTELQSRIDSARIELDVAQAAFKYRLVVVHPAERPRGAKKPNIPVVVLGGLIASLLIAVLASVLADIASGRLIEAPQATWSVNIPLLGEVDPP